MRFVQLEDLLRLNVYTDLTPISSTAECGQEFPIGDVTLICDPDNHRSKTTSFYITSFSPFIGKLQIFPI
ncbi:hypothetical protein OJAV_G00193530 [Oryzias javanicus]|uniref:Uncharacterized protein n=1 Tax=Oryzias javanicus TaxID=123683 RepID=A0A437CAW4_ORYJA|nr:hypothetical protein OJAV_G00193530 [Oryzias javanicus]